MYNFSVIGNDENALRVFWDSNGCEIRFASMIVHCNKELSALLNIIINDTYETGLQKIIKLSNIDDTTELNKIIKKTINEFSSIGILPDNWHESWTNL